LSSNRNLDAAKSRSSRTRAAGSQVTAESAKVKPAQTKAAAAQKAWDNLQQTFVMDSWRSPPAGASGASIDELVAADETADVPDETADDRSQNPVNQPDNKPKQPVKPKQQAQTTSSGTASQAAKNKAAAKKKKAAVKKKADAKKNADAKKGLPRLAQLEKLYDTAVGDSRQAELPASTLASGDGGVLEVEAALHHCPGPPGAVKRPWRSSAFPYENPFRMGLLYGRAGRLTGLFGGFRPGQWGR
jgi:hypothetical protein